MSGAITRLPSEKFADFAARQKAAQADEKARHDAELKSQRTMRKSRRRNDFEGSDFDYSMNS